MTQTAFPAPVPTRSRAYVGLFAASGACFVLGFLLLVVGLKTSSLMLVYASIAASVLWLPLLIAGIVVLALESRRR